MSFTTHDKEATLAIFANHPPAWSNPQFYPPKPPEGANLLRKGAWIGVCEGLDAGAFAYDPKRKILRKVIYKND